MSGHSKWSQIKRKKAVTDTKRGQVFTRLGKEITIAARLGGGDPDGNARLRLAIERARKSSMPNDNIKRAIAKGAGAAAGGNFEELVYEGYGPAAVAIMIEAATDNRNRTIGEIRHAFSKYGGTFGETGSVGWMFSKQGIILVPKQSHDEDTLLNIVLNAGASDFKSDDSDYFEIETPPDQFESVLKALTTSAIAFEEERIALIASTEVSLNSEEVDSLQTLVEALEELDDVQNVYTNASNS